MADFKASVLAKKAVELAPGAEVRQNMELTTVDKAASVKPGLEHTTGFGTHK